ncbi:hypothetical protein, partial [uncultured Odoribacter sp.]|uniref:hypothetical protein n=1 Tax=uncultured Odoribacter sp. TaxID=876416 RepID=UPI00260B01A9
MILGIQLSRAQERQVSGTVTDTGDGTTLTGVTEVVKEKVTEISNHTRLQKEICKTRKSNRTEHFFPVALFFYTADPE